MPQIMQAHVGQARADPAVVPGVVQEMPGPGGCCCSGGFSFSMLPSPVNNQSIDTLHFWAIRMQLAPSGRESPLRHLKTVV